MIMMRYLILCFSLMFFSCSFLNNVTEENGGEIYPHLWEYDFDIGYFLGLDPIIYKDKVIYTPLDEERNDFLANHVLQAFDKESKEILWTWDETVDETGEQFNSARRYYIYNNRLYISTGVDYAINLDNGTTEHYLDNNKIGGQRFYGFEDNIYARFGSENNLSVSIKTTKTNSFEWKEILRYEDTDTSILSFRQILIDKSNTNLLYLPYTFAPGKGAKSSPGLIVYDIIDNKVISDKIITGVGDNHPVEQLAIIHDDKIFIPTRGKTICLNKNTGELIWQTSVIGSASLSGILFPENNLLYVNTEFGVYCLDPETGAVIWSELNGEKEGNSSRMQYHNDVIYYIGGGMFHARDANTGEKLLFFEAPSFAKDGGAFFQPVMTIDQENDKIYTASYTHAYCYPTLR